jgi:hypothetical protein
VICLSVSRRPNQVFHQNKNGINTISHPVRRKITRWRLVIRRRDAFFSTVAGVSTRELLSGIAEEIFREF